MAIEKFNLRRQAKFVGSLRGGMTRTQAARLAGVSYPTVWKFVKANPEFADECDVAETQACDPIESKLREKALAGDNTCILVWLYNRSHGRWQDRRTPIIQTQSEDNEALKEILERLKKEEGAKSPPADSPTLPE